MRKYLPLLLLAFSVPALAHPGHGTDSFQAGFLHPLTGLDHLLMLTGALVASTCSSARAVMTPNAQARSVPKIHAKYHIFSSLLST